MQGDEVGAGLRDADDRLAALQFLAGDAVVQVALDIERGHRRVCRVVEPAPAAQAAPAIVLCHELPPFRDGRKLCTSPSGCQRGPADLRWTPIRSPSTLRSYRSDCRADMSITTVSRSGTRPPGLLYSLDEWPPPAQLALLGVQYAVLDAIYLVLVAIILRSANLSPSESVDVMGIACVALAIGTMLQALPRGPIGAGFLAPPVYSATYLAPSVMAAQIGGMSLVFGMTISAGIMEVVVALLLMRLRVVITPVLSGLSVFVVGLQLGVVGVGQMLDVQHAAVPSFHAHLSVTTLTLATCVGLSIWGRGTLKLLCTMLGLVIGMGMAIGMHLIPAGGWRRSVMRSGLRRRDQHCCNITSALNCCRPSWRRVLRPHCARLA